MHSWMEVSTSGNVLLTFDFLLEARTHNEPNHQSRDEGTAQRNAQRAPPWQFVKTQHCAHEDKTEQDGDMRENFVSDEEKQKLKWKKLVPTHFNLLLNTCLVYFRSMTFHHVIVPSKKSDRFFSNVSTPMLISYVQRYTKCPSGHANGQYRQQYQREYKLL